MADTPRLLVGGDLRAVDLDLCGQVTAAGVERLRLQRHVTPADPRTLPFKELCRFWKRYLPRTSGGPPWDFWTEERNRHQFGLDYEEARVEGWV